MFVHCALCGVGCVLRVCAGVHRHIRYWALSAVRVRAGFGQMCLCACVLCIVCITKSILCVVRKAATQINTHVCTCAHTRAH